MAHKVLVMSPLHNKGTTVVSSMITQCLAMNNKTSMIVFTEPSSLLPMYLGSEGLSDPTRSVMQIVKLIDNGSIDNDDIIEYASTMTTNAYVMNLADASLPDKDRVQVVTHIYSRVTTNVVVCDNSEDIDTKFTKTLVSESDMIFIVIESSTKDYKRLKLWVNDPVLKNNPNIYVIINKYNEVIDSVRGIANFIGFPANKVCKVHYNPWITKCCLTGTLHTILPLAREHDPRVANLLNDIDEINQCIDSSIIMSSKRGSF